MSLETSGHPLVPSHEIAGEIVATAEAVGHLKVGQRVGVGWVSGSCMRCRSCWDGNHHLCASARGICVCNHGGFAERVRTAGRFPVPLPDALASETAAPLMCAGITVFAPLDEIGAQDQEKMRVGVVGIGGLGHLALQFAKAMGCEVTALSGTAAKSDEACGFGDNHFEVTSEAVTFTNLAGSFDLLLVTAEGDLPWDAYLTLFRPKGTLWLLGVPHQPLAVNAGLLMRGRYSIRGSFVGSTAQMERMLRLAARHGISAKTEVFPLRDVNAAVKRVRSGKRALSRGSRALRGRPSSYGGPAPLWHPSHPGLDRAGQ